MKKLFDKINVSILMGLASAMAQANGSSGGNLFDNSVGTGTGTAQTATTIADTGTNTLKSFGPLILSGAQLVALGLGALTFWFLYQNGQPQNEGRGLMKKALFAGIASGGLYFSPRFVGMAGRTLFPT